MVKLLVVDDDPDLLFGLVAVLKKNGYEVAAITRGEETFTQIRSFWPDLILMDVLLSGKDGRKICKEIKTTEDTRHIAVVMISAHPGVSHSIKEIGAEAFIAKPFAVRHLLQTIQDIVNHS